MQAYRAFSEASEASAAYAGRGVIVGVWLHELQFANSCIGINLAKWLERGLVLVTTITARL